MLIMSRPAWDAWIEIVILQGFLQNKPCRVPHGTRGLKSRLKVWRKGRKCRVPHGTRGLKFDLRSVPST